MGFFIVFIAMKRMTVEGFLEMKRFFWRLISSADS